LERSNQIWKMKKKKSVKSNQKENEDYNQNNPDRETSQEPYPDLENGKNPTKKARFKPDLNEFGESEKSRSNPSQEKDPTKKVKMKKWIVL